MASRVSPRRPISAPDSCLQDHLVAALLQQIDVDLRSTLHLLQQAGEELTDGLGLLVIHFFAQCLHGSGLPGLLLRGGRRRLRRLALLSGRLFRFGGLRPLFLRLLLGGRRGGENLLFLLRAVAHPDLPGQLPRPRKPDFCSAPKSQRTHRPVQAKLPQGILDGLILGSCPLHQ